MKPLIEKFLKQMAEKGTETVNRETTEFFFLKDTDFSETNQKKLEWFIKSLKYFLLEIKGLRNNYKLNWETIAEVFPEIKKKKK